MLTRLPQRVAAVAQRDIVPRRLYSSSESSASPTAQPVRPVAGAHDQLNKKDDIKARRLFRPSTILGLLVVGTLVGYQIDTHLNASVLQRNVRTAIAGAEIALDYK